MSHDPRRTGLGCAADVAQLYAGEYATRLGRGLCGWVNEIVPGAASIVLTTALAPLLTYNIPAGRRAMVVQYCYALETVNDNCQFEFGFTDAADGAGTFYPLGPHKHVWTGAANQGRTAFDQNIGPPPAMLAYSDGVRCITFRVDANDAGAEITLGWHAWWEYE